MKVKEVMNANFPRITPRTPVREVVQLLVRHHKNNLMVVDANDAPAGVVTYKDLFRRLLPTVEELMRDKTYWTQPENLEERLVDIMHLPIQEIMTTRLISADPEMNALQAGALMNAHRVKQLPVIAEGKLIGEISYIDIMWGLILKYRRSL
ncbi:MAG: CBS domain-containing protein [Acidobacteriota bacterium]